MHIKRERRCVSCKQPKHQSELLRIAKVNNDFQLDIEYTLGGRGAYVCNNYECINTAIKKKIFNRAFKTCITNDIYKELEEYKKEIIN